MGPFSLLDIRWYFASILHFQVTLAIAKQCAVLFTHLYIHIMFVSYLLLFLFVAWCGVCDIVVVFVISMDAAEYGFGTRKIAFLCRCSSFRSQSGQ